MVGFGPLLVLRHGERRQLIANGLKIPNKRTVCTVSRIAELARSKNHSCLDALAMIGGEFRLDLRDRPCDCNPAVMAIERLIRFRRRLGKGINRQLAWTGEEQ